MNQQPQPAVSFFKPTLVVASAVYAVGSLPIGDAVRTPWDPITLAIAAWIGA